MAIGANAFPNYDALGGKPHEVGEQITVFYNPANPGQVVRRRAIYRRSIRLLMAVALLIFGILGVRYVVSRERVFKRLRQFDARR